MHTITDINAFVLVHANMGHMQQLHMHATLHNFTNAPYIYDARYRVHSKRTTLRNSSLTDDCPHVFGVFVGHVSVELSSLDSVELTSEHGERTVDYRELTTLV